MIRTLIAMVVAVSAGIAIALGQPGIGLAGEDLGKVHFATSCKPEAQQLFDRAMLYQHSFWYRASQRSFEEALKIDPECAIAYWGIALSLLYNPHVAPPAKNLAEGAAALEKGKAVGAKTQRERDYLDALSAMYADYTKVDHRTRVLAYLKAMERLAQLYPDDDEAQIHYALALNVGASPTDKTYANQLMGAAILEPIFQRQPEHPGVAHYLIHLYDNPPIAEKGLDAARRYAKIAPAAAHAQHMPSHIFTRVGYWQESIASNIVSARVAKEAQDFHDQLHSMDYLVYAYLQLAQDTKARAVIDEMNKVTGFTETFLPGPYALAASPSRYALERGDWQGAAELTVRPSPLAHVQAITHFARALGAGRSGHPDAAKADIAKLAELRDNLRAAKDAGGAGRYPVASCKCLDALCPGQARGRSQGHERGRRSRGQDREAPGHAGRADPGARTLRHHAAGPRDGQGSADGLRSDDQEGAQSFGGLYGSREVRHEGRRCRQGAAIFRQGCRAERGSRRDENRSGGGSGVRGQGAVIEAKCCRGRKLTSSARPSFRRERGGITDERIAGAVPVVRPHVSIPSTGA